MTTDVAPSVITVTLSNVGPQGPSGVGAAPNGRIITSGVVSVAASDDVIEVNKATATPVSVNPTAITPWKPYTIKDASGAADSNPITVTPTSGTFDGLASQAIAVPYGSLRFYSNGTNLRLI